MSPPTSSDTVTPRTAAWMRRAFTLDFRSLAAFRMAIGTIVAVDAVLRCRDVPLMFGSAGMFPVAVLRDFLGGPCAWSLAMIVDADWCGPAVLALEFTAGLLLAAGCGTRWASIAAWAAVVSVLRRTAPATNAGDSWLACLLFWGMFLPLGETWSWDRRRTGSHGGVRSAATVALVLQIAVVYLAAGLSKCNGTWLSGDAVRHAMSVHDHGTPLGEWLFGSGWLSRPLSRGVLAVELVGPVALVAAPSLRPAVVACFMTFHAATCLTMSLGLFGYVGLAAWLAVVPARAWDRLGTARAAPATPAGRPSGVGTVLCVMAGLLALVSLGHDVGRWRTTPLPRWLVGLINVPCMHQEWRMFDEVRPQAQWVHARGELADGRLIDVVRGGRPWRDERPEGGFTSLPHHRWHKLFWCLANRPDAAAVRQAVATALARHWNARHGPEERLVALDIRVARQGLTAGDEAFQEMLIAAWPPRDAAGSGNLDRLLGGRPTGGEPDADPIREPIREPM